MLNPTTTTRVVISTDVTDWPSHRRDELVKTIQAFEARFTGPDLGADVESTGWTLEAYHEAMEALLRSHPTQATVINEAIRNGGTIDRAQVYSLAGYPESRSLKGFTRPVNRIMGQLIESGSLPEEAEDLLEPIYDLAVKSFQRTQGFRVPAELVKILWEVNGGKWPAAS